MRKKDELCCEHEKCTKSPEYGETEESEPRFCRRHKPDNFVFIKDIKRKEDNRDNYANKRIEGNTLERKLNRR